MNFRFPARERSALLRIPPHRTVWGTSMPAPATDENKFLAYCGVLQWAQGVVEQAALLADADRRQKANDYGLPFVLSFHAACDHYVSAAEKFLCYRDWAVELGMFATVDFACLDRFPRQAIRDLRNMREHAVDYYRSETRTQRWFMETPEFRADALSRHDNMIGSRLDFVAFTLAVESLLPSLRAEPYPKSLYSAA